MRLLVAARLSQTQAGQTGLETQTAEVERWAKLGGHTIAHVAADHKSGTVPPWERPELRTWLTDPAKRARYDAVVGYSFDRLSRGDKQSTNAIEAWAHKWNKQLLTVDGLIFPSEGTDGIRWDIAGRLAHQYWLETSERYRRMQNHLRANGFLVGRPPFAFQVVCAEACGAGLADCKHHKTIAPIPELAPIVTGIFNRIAKGSSLAQVCRWLDSKGIKPNSKAGEAWAPKSVAQIIRSETYKGRRLQGEQILKVPAAVDDTLWRRANNRLDTSKRGQRGPKAGNAPALLTGVLFCAGCKERGSMIFDANGKPTKKRDGVSVESPMYRTGKIYYRCHGVNPNPRGCGNMIPVYVLEHLATRTMQLAQEQWTEVVVTPDDHASRIESARDALSDLTARFGAGKIDAAEFAAESGRMAAELESLRQSQPDGPVTETIETGETVGEHWAGLDTAGKRAMLKDSVKFFAEKSKRILPGAVFWSWDSRVIGFKPLTEISDYQLDDLMWPPAPPQTA